MLLVYRNKQPHLFIFLLVCLQVGLVPVVRRESKEKLVIQAGSDQLEYQDHLDLKEYRVGEILLTKVNKLRGQDEYKSLPEIFLMFSTFKDWFEIKYFCSKASMEVGLEIKLEILDILLYNNN